MKKEQKKLHQKARRAHRTRARIHGTAERPRLSVYRSLSHISAQVINDENGTTLAYADDKDVKGTKTERAAAVGKKVAELVKAKGVNTVVFDRGANLYHGRVKALAEGAREAGLEF